MFSDMSLCGSGYSNSSGPLLSASLCLCHLLRWIPYFALHLQQRDEELQYIDALVYSTVRNAIVDIHLILVLFISDDAFRTISTRRALTHCLQDLSESLALAPKQPAFQKPLLEQITKKRASRHSHLNMYSDARVFRE